MGSMLVDQCLGRIPEEEFRDDEKPDVLFTIEGFLENVASVAISGKFYNAASVDGGDQRD
jgi:hypothetical protein